MANISALLMLAFFVWGVVGVQLFANVRDGHALGANANFRTTGEAEQTATFNPKTNSNLN